MTWTAFWRSSRHLNFHVCIITLTCTAVEYIQHSAVYSMYAILVVSAMHASATHSFVVIVYKGVSGYRCMPHGANCMG